MRWGGRCAGTRAWHSGAPALASHTLRMRGVLCDRQSAVVSFWCVGALLCFGARVCMAHHSIQLWAGDGGRTQMGHRKHMLRARFAHRTWRQGACLGVQICA